MNASTMLREARDARTSPGRLAELAAFDPYHLPPGVGAMNEWTARRPVLRELIAGNPNTDSETLLSLVVEFPAEVLTNPAFELLLLLETPDWLRGQPEQIRRRVAHCAEAPEAAILALLDDASGEVQAGLAAHPHTPSGAVHAFAISPIASVRKAAASNPKVDEGWRELLVRAGSLPSLEGWSEEPGPVTEEELVRLLAAGEWSRSLVARHPQTPAAWFQLVPGRALESGQERWRSRCSLPGGDPEARRSQQPEPPLVRVALASNPRLPPALLESLAEDPEGEVQDRLGANPAAPEAALLRLIERNLASSLRGTSRLVAIARNPAATPACLRQLSTCGQEEAMRAALDHPRIEPDWRGLVLRCEIARRLAEEGKPASARKLEPEGTNELSSEDLGQLARGAPAAQRLVAAHPQAPAPALRALAVSPDERVRAALAANPAAEDSLKLALSQSPEYAVLVALAGARELPEATLDSLVESAVTRKILGLALALADRSDLRFAHCLRLIDLPGATSRVLATRSEATRDQLFGHFERAGGRLLGLLLESPSASPSTLVEYARSADWAQRQSVGMNPRTPPEALGQLARDDDFRIRAAVAANRSCPEDLLRLLAADPTPHVQQLARAKQEARAKKA